MGASIRKLYIQKQHRLNESVNLHPRQKNMIRNYSKAIKTAMRCKRPILIYLVCPDSTHGCISTCEL